MAEAPDAELVAAALRRDGPACGLLFRRHAPKVLRTLRAGLHLTPAEAEDVMQEAFIRAFRNLERLRQPEQFGAWVQIIARRAAFQDLKGRTRREQADASLVAEAADAVQQQVSEGPAVAIARELLQQLEEGQERRIVHRFYVDGDCTAQELADELGIARGTVTSRLTRFRARIKRRLAALVAAADPALKGSGT